MTVRVIGLDELQKAFADIVKNLENVEIVTKPLAEGMRQYVHVDSGYLLSTIDYSGNVAFADASYAGAEADRGGDHDYAEASIEGFDIEEYANSIVEPF